MTGCPAAGFCTAKRDGKQALLPVREKKKEKREVRLTLFIMKKEDGTAALRQRPDTGLLAGLWEFPHVEGELDEAAAAAQLAEWHVTPLRWEQILHAKHEFTHLRWRMTGYLLTAAGEGEAGLAVGRCSGAAAAGHPLGLSGIYGGAGRQYRRGMR